jgi:hypothetical protein
LKIGYILLYVEREEGQVEQKCDPVPVDKEKECQEPMHSSFGDNVCVETVAEVDWIDIITVNFVSCIHTNNSMLPVKARRNPMNGCNAWTETGNCGLPRPPDMEDRYLVSEEQHTILSHCT